MISVHFQDKAFSIRVIQVNAPTTDAKDAEADQFYEDLQDWLERISFSLQGIGLKSRMLRDTVE